jgi:hypothetical protein
MRRATRSGMSCATRIATPPLKECPTRGHRASHPCRVQKRAHPAGITAQAQLGHRQVSRTTETGQPRGIDPQATCDQAFECPLVRVVGQPPAVQEHQRRAFAGHPIRCRPAADHRRAPLQVTLIPPRCLTACPHAASTSQGGPAGEGPLRSLPLVPSTTLPRRAPARSPISTRCGPPDRRHSGAVPADFSLRHAARRLRKPIRKMITS